MDITERARELLAACGGCEGKKMLDDGGPLTGPLFLIPQKPADEAGEGTFVLIPVVDEPDALVAVFSDGSYTRWTPFSP